MTMVKAGLGGRGAGREAGRLMDGRGENKLITPKEVIYFKQKTAIEL